MKTYLAHKKYSFNYKHISIQSKPIPLIIENNGYIYIPIINNGTYIRTIKLV